MRRTNSAVVAMILAIAFYFMLFWGFESLRIFTSPTYGLDDVWRSQIVFGIGRFLSLSPEGLIKLAAVFGAIKLTVAGVCAVHILDRFRSLVSGRADPEILEAGLLLAVIASIIAVAPAIWSQNADLVREHVINLLLAGTAAALCIIERNGIALATVAATATPATPVMAQARAAAIKSPKWFAPWR